MASQWYYRLKGQEKGPVSFRDLAELVRSEDLSQDDLVRRDLTDKWGPVEDVIGLLRAAGKEPAVADAATTSPTRPSVARPPASAEPKTSRTKPKKSGTKPTRFRRPGNRGILIGSAVAVTVLVISYCVWHHYAHPLFPAIPGAVGTTRPISGPRVLAAAQAARAESPSVPGLVSGVPQRVPGLEEFDATDTTSLTDDLRTIVFGANVGPAGMGDLWIADRADVSKLFESPAPIQNCNTRQFDCKPSISPNGLQLLFMRSRGRPQCFYARRSSRSHDFGEPQLLEMPELCEDERKITFTRFLDDTHVLVSVNNGEAMPRFSFYVIKPPIIGTEFSPPEEINLDGCGGWACLRSDRLLAYFGTPKGIFVQGRDSPDEKFTRGFCLFDAEACGPVTGAIWVAPGDDVAFYCSRGPGQESTGKKSIWMIHF